MSFKRGVSTKIALNIGQPDFYQEFWEIYPKSFRDKKPDEKYSKSELISYPWVIPVYVYSLNDIWDGSISFDVCPVDFRKEKQKNKSWSWRHSRTREDIGKVIFNTEEEAWDKWRDLYKPNDNDHPLRSYSREGIIKRRERHMKQKNKNNSCIE